MTPRNEMKISSEDFLYVFGSNTDRNGNKLGKTKIRKRKQGVGD